MTHALKIFKKISFERVILRRMYELPKLVKQNKLLKLRSIRDLVR